ncbi:zinc-ribbon domain-containing protein [Haladaptatus litoreus]|uniref:Zinc-ribbon domain-containing protein n=1 Tax=Haladaptatus litoreus TaxID=553468 RepID=A0A1N6YN76_9EURY|nr:zinc ribbon domain-containing protein [Haladaptatus litoreus]SIR16055.1 zinc-ribbon domain-containing protein [Haladaptatus litoreus]
MSPRRSSNFCAHCGAALTSGASFCSQCGTAVETGSTGFDFQSTLDGIAKRGRGSDVKSRRPEFRRRIQDLTVEGWEVKHDYGDRVVMIRRKFGSIPVHILLLLFTTPVGNLLYAWYSYSPGADRIELREDGGEQFMEESGYSTNWTLQSAAAFVVSSVLGFFATILGLIIMLINVGSGIFLFGAVFFILGLILLLLAPQHVPGFKSLTTFGTVRSTDEKVISEPTAPCTICSGPVGTGVERTFSEKEYFAGMPVTTVNKGENKYCRSCASGDVKPVETEFDSEFDFESEFA